MAKTAILAIKILADAKGAQKGMQDASKSTSKFASGVGKASAVAAVGLAGVSAVMVSGVKAAADDAQAQAILAKTMENTTGATDKQIASMEDFISKTSLASGVADDELRPALGNLLRATKDQTKAQELLHTAMDISAATGKPLEAVSQALSKGYLGNVGALGKMGVATKDAKGKTKTFAQILGDLQNQFGGAQAAKADTAAGKMDRYKVAVDELKESVGASLLPVMEKLAGVLGKVADFAAKHQKAFIIIAGALVAVAAAVMAVNTALKIYRATMIVIQAVQAATFLTNPVFLIVAAIVLLVVAIVLLWKRSKTFRNFVLGMWKAIKAATRVVVDFFKAAWKVAFAIVKGYFTVYKTIVVTAFNVIKAIIKAVTGFFKSAWNTAVSVVTGYFNVWKAVVTGIFNGIKAVISTVASWLSTAFDVAVSTIKNVFTTLVDIVTAPFDAIVSAVQTAIQWVQNLIDKIKDIHLDITPGFDLPGWLPGNQSAPAPALTRGARTGPAATSSGGGGTVIHIHGAIDPEGTARAVKRVLAGHGRRVGVVV